MVVKVSPEQRYQDKKEKVAKSRGIQIDSINIDVEGDVDLCGFTGISSDVRPGAQQFRVNMHSIFYFYRLN